MAGAIFQLLARIRAVIWATAFTQSINTNNSGAGAQNFRFIMAKANVSGTGFQVRVTFTPVTSGSNLSISAAYIGLKGAGAADFDGNQKQLLFSGIGTATLTAGGAAVTSDTLPFVIDGSTDVVVSLATGSNDRRYGAGATGMTFYFKVAANDAATTAASGYTLDTNVGPFTLLEIAS